MRRQTFEFWLLRLPHPFNTQNLRGLSSLHYLQCSHSHILRGPDWCRPFATEKSSSGFLWQSVSSKKPLRKAFKTEPRELLGGTEEKSDLNCGSLICHSGKSIIFYLSGFPDIWLLVTFFNTSIDERYGAPNKVKTWSSKRYKRALGWS